MTYVEKDIDRTLRTHIDFFRQNTTDFSEGGLQAIQDFLEDYQEEHQICVNANFIRWVFGEYKSFSEYVLYNGNQRIKTLDELRDVARLLPIDDWRSGFIFIDPNIDTIKI